MFRSTSIYKWLSCFSKILVIIILVMPLMLSRSLSSTVEHSLSETVLIHRINEQNSERVICISNITNFTLTVFTLWDFYALGFKCINLISYKYWTWTLISWNWHLIYTVSSKSSGTNNSYSNSCFRRSRKITYTQD